MKRKVAHSFVIVHCPDTDCGVHFIGLDENDKAICEMVIDRKGITSVMTELLSVINPHEKAN